MRTRIRTERDRDAVPSWKKCTQTVYRESRMNVCSKKCTNRKRNEQCQDTIFTSRNGLRTKNIYRKRYAVYPIGSPKRYVGFDIEIPCYRHGDWGGWVEPTTR